ncbi:MAG TPA: hypothetical protein VKA21_14440 [Candidatus Binatia bacterium]|nr:hypothetical protein [Candidatus Binatia bacterium]
MSNMLRSLAVLLVVSVAPAFAGVEEIAKCQKVFAREGAKFAMRVLRSNLRCTNEIVECQLQCELGEFGPPCESFPPPCCDPDDTGSSQAFADCMNAAQGVCDVEAAKRELYEIGKVDRITTACLPLSQDELCGAQAEGLNFATLNAGCLALDPGYVCNLTNLVACVGGPLEHALLDQITAVLHPRASDAVAALNLQAQFPDLPIARKVKGTVAEGKIDVWQITGNEGDQVVVRVTTRDDNGNDTSNLHPVLSLLDDGGTVPVADTNVRTVGCAVPNVCGSGCPQFKRTLPFSGTFHLAIQAFAGDACTGGKYRLVVVSPGGSAPVLVADDVDP